MPRARHGAQSAQYRLLVVCPSPSWAIDMFLMLSCRLTKTNAHDNVSYIDKVFGMSREFIVVLAQVRRTVLCFEIFVHAGLDRLPLWSRGHFARLPQRLRKSRRTEKNQSHGTATVPTLKHEKRRHCTSPSKIGAARRAISTNASRRAIASISTLSRCVLRRWDRPV